MSVHVSHFDFPADDGVRLVGTLTTPGSDGLVPAALLVNGSGPLDRDSNMPGQPLEVASALAAALASKGVATLRFDKRGVGESEGEYLAMSFDLETEDAARALHALRGAPGVDAARVTVVGHSVGATVAIRLSARYEWIAGAVLLAVAASPGAEVMRIQSERIAASLRGPRRLAAGRFLRRQETVRDALLASEGDVADIEGGLPARWFREYMAYDPALDLPRIRCPILAVTGRNDIQVDPDDIERMRAIVTAPFVGETPKALTHVLRQHPGRPSLASYRAQLAHPVDAGLLEKVASWTSAR